MGLLLFSLHSIEFLMQVVFAFPKGLLFLHLLFFSSMVVLQVEKFPNINQDNTRSCLKFPSTFKQILHQDLFSARLLDRQGFLYFCADKSYKKFFQIGISFVI